MILSSDCRNGDLTDPAHAGIAVVSPLSYTTPRDTIDIGELTANIVG
jgi:hypothetical protein